MKRHLALIAFCLAILASAGIAGAREKGPITGTWECKAHGTEQGDIDFTLTLQQNKEFVDGTIQSPMGGTQISSGTFHHNMLEIHLDTPQGNYILLGRYKKGELSGTWSGDTGKGAWEGRKSAHSAKP